MPVASVSTMPAVRPKLWKSGSAETATPYNVDPQTGLAVFRSGRPVTIEDIKTLEEEDDVRLSGAR